MQLLELTPEYGRGDCYPSACMGHARLLNAAIEAGEDAAAESLAEHTYYVQGWFLWRYRDGSGVGGFPHGFLLDAAAAAKGRPCLIDAVFLRYGLLGDPFWLPVQLWTYGQVERYLELDTTPKCWPLCCRTGGTELEDRIGYQRAFAAAGESLAIK